MAKHEEVLKKIEAQAGKSFLPIVGRKKGRLLESVISKTKPKLILEIGTLVGYSAILMGQVLKKGKIISLEISNRLAEAAKDNIRNANLSRKITVVTGNALKIIPELEGPFDIIFIDALKEEYLKYLKLMERSRKLKKGTVVIADNAKIFADDMGDYLRYVRTSNKYSSHFYDFGDDGMEVSIKK